MSYFFFCYSRISLIFMSLSSSSTFWSEGPLGNLFNTSMFALKSTSTCDFDCSFLILISSSCFFACSLISSNSIGLNNFLFSASSFFLLSNSGNSTSYLYFSVGSTFLWISLISLITSFDCLFVFRLSSLLMRISSIFLRIFYYFSSLALSFSFSSSFARYYTSSSNYFDYSSRYWVCLSSLSWRSRLNLRAANTALPFSPYTSLISRSNARNSTSNYYFRRFFSSITLFFSSFSALSLSSYSKVLTPSITLLWLGCSSVSLFFYCFTPCSDDLLTSSLPFKFSLLFLSLMSEPFKFVFLFSSSFPFPLLSFVTSCFYNIFYSSSSSS